MINVTPGWTERVRERLEADGAPFLLPLGFTVRPKAWTKDGVVVPLLGDYGIVDQSIVDPTDPDAGVVYYDPVGNEFNVTDSPYSFRWDVIDGDGKQATFPNHAASKLICWGP